MPGRAHKSALARKSKSRAYSFLAKSALLGLMVVSGFVSFALLAGALMLFGRTKSVGSFLVLLAISLWLGSKVRALRVKYRRFELGYSQLPAEQVIAKARSERRAFALFLRGFEAERQSLIYTGGGVLDEVGSGEAEISARPFEALLVNILQSDLPVVTLSDPRDPAPMAGAYRFEKLPADWQGFVCELLRDAFPVVLHLTSFTDGIKAELNLIKYSGYSQENKHGYPAKTVIVVDKYLAGRNSLEGKHIREILSGYGHIIFERHGSRWSRKHERRFHTRLERCLRTLEMDNPRRPILKAERTLPSYTPRWFDVLFKFIKGPAAGSATFSCFIIFAGSIAEGWPVFNSLPAIFFSFLIWLVFSLVLTVVLSLLKGGFIVVGLIAEWLKG